MISELLDMKEIDLGNGGGGAGIPGSFLKLNRFEMLAMKSNQPQVHVSLLPITNWYKHTGCANPSKHQYFEPH